MAAAGSPGHGTLGTVRLLPVALLVAAAGMPVPATGDPRDEPPVALADKVARGELGVKTGKGFYTYPDPECARDDFLMAR